MQGGLIEGRARVRGFWVAHCADCLPWGKGGDWEEVR